MCVGLSGGGLELVAGDGGRILHPIQDVVLDGGGEEDGLLGHSPDIPPTQDNQSIIQSVNQSIIYGEQKKDKDNIFSFPYNSLYN